MYKKNNNWYSEDSDWNDANGNPIAIWEGCIVQQDEHDELKQFFKTEFYTDVEPLGMIEFKNGTNSFIFTVKSNVSGFSINRFKLDGVRWVYDAFSEVNGGRKISDEEIKKYYEYVTKVN